MAQSGWYNIDNVAKVFMATYNKRETLCMRVCCMLAEDVRPGLLMEALERTVEELPHFQVRIRKGFFWFYLAPTDKKVQVHEEDGRICPLLYSSTHKGVLHYDVSYYKNRITLEIFHALSDGTGALEFLNVIVGHYLKLAHPQELADYSTALSSTGEERIQDSFRQYYDRANSTQPIPGHKPRAYKIPGRLLPYDQMRFMEFHMPADLVRANAKKYGCTVGAYISALLMMAIAQDMPASKRKYPVAISMPVNLRGMFGSKTSRNFFNSVTIRHYFTEEATLQEIAREFDTQLKAALDPEKIKLQMNNYAKLEEMIYTKMAPLFLKQPVVRFFSIKEHASVTAVVSNLGVIKPAPELAPYITGYSGYCSHSGLFTTIFSYGNDLGMGLSSAYASTEALQHFVRLLRAEGIPVSVDASEVV